MAENNVKTEEITKKTANDWFYERITQLKAQLPKKFHKMDLIKHLPKEYDSYGGGIIIDRVMAMRTTDMAVLEALEKCVKEF